MLLTAFVLLTVACEGEIESSDPELAVGLAMPFVRSFSERLFREVSAELLPEMLDVEEEI